MSDDGTKPGDPLVIAQALTDSLNTMSARLDGLNTYGHRNRRMIWGLVGSLVLDIILTVALVRVAVSVNHAEDKATRAHDQQVSTCVSTNEARALNVQLWEYVLTIPPSQQLSEEQVKRISDFRVFLRRTFAPRDCSKI